MAQTYRLFRQDHRLTVRIPDLVLVNDKDTYTCQRFQYRVKSDNFERGRGYVPSVASLPEPDGLCMLNIADKNASRLAHCRWYLFSQEGGSRDPDCRASAARGISFVALCEITRRSTDFQLAKLGSNTLRVLHIACSQHESVSRTTGPFAARARGAMGVCKAI